MGIRSDPRADPRDGGGQKPRFWGQKRGFREKPPTPPETGGVWNNAKEDFDISRLQAVFLRPIPRSCALYDRYSVKNATKIAFDKEGHPQNGGFLTPREGGKHPPFQGGVFPPPGKTPISGVILPRLFIKPSAVL